MSWFSAPQTMIHTIITLLSPNLLRPLPHGQPLIHSNLAPLSKFLSTALSLIFHHAAPPWLHQTYTEAVAAITDFREKSALPDSQHPTAWSLDSQSAASHWPTCSPWFWLLPKPQPSPTRWSPDLQHALKETQIFCSYCTPIHPAPPISNPMTTSNFTLASAAHPLSAVCSHFAFS